MKMYKHVKNATMRVTMRNLRSYTSQSTNARKIWVVMSTCNLPRPLTYKKLGPRCLINHTFPFRSQQRGHCLAGAVGRQAMYYGPA